LRKVLRKGLRKVLRRKGVVSKHGQCTIP
jgi:hypothetical protein